MKERKEETVSALLAIIMQIVTSLEAKKIEKRRYSDPPLLIPSESSVQKTAAAVAATWREEKRKGKENGCRHRRGQRRHQRKGGV